MALFKWLAETNESCLLELMRVRVRDLGMVIDSSVSNSQQVYAVDAVVAGISHHSRVKLIATWSNRSLGEFQIEVQSDEPLLLKGTRCELMAIALQSSFPSK